MLQKLRANQFVGATSWGLKETKCKVVLQQWTVEVVVVVFYMKSCQRFHNRPLDENLNMEVTYFLKKKVNDH